MSKTVNLNIEAKPSWAKSSTSRLLFIPLSLAENESRICVLKEAPRGSAASPIKPVASSAAANAKGLQRNRVSDKLKPFRWRSSTA
ncbi:hypothetical protein [Mesorhizobium sp.]|uniref:hypothetical protein n=1 Tax=Mesorhizobium sp. TaxID=1871066 RepID=UPI000FE30BA1|nr:hypothetical protein [Mesorhizobium sp.]RWA71743.1 MAG: hypothetical protein EOQ28_18335 [Mesorhizobium sp.]RWC01039.1 MAG: hypothetical protein EOQ57_15745 [Mesorhizobium sp.]RWG88821.1 MAG: hypothetical protein EOQ70_11160 [Mesorhizobium sp.]RWK19235.1 MAG: hypothetical protein EOR41_10300 [Mesorhizobium sp.]